MAITMSNSIKVKPRFMKLIPARNRQAPEPMGNLRVSGPHPRTRKETSAANGWITSGMDQAERGGWSSGAAREPRLVSRNKLPGATGAGPVFSGQEMLLRDGDKFFCIGAD